MRLLHLATFLQGGAGRVITDLAIHQHRDGHEVVVVTSRTGFPGYAHYGAYVDDLAAAGVSLQLIDSLFTRDYAANLAVVEGLTQIYPSGREPDVIHAHAAIPTLIGMLWAGSRGVPVPVVQTMHGWGVAKTLAQASADVSLMNLAQGIAVPSVHSRSVMTSVGVAPHRLTVIPYGVDELRAEPDPMDLAGAREMAEARRQGGLVVACVGTIGARKNQALLVEAIRRVTPATDIQAWIVGDGDAAGLEEIVRQAGLVDRVRVCGYSRHARYLAAQADVLVLPSRSEGQPLAILEAFADGALVVVSDIPELAELVGPASGLTFRADDATSLAATLLQVSRMPRPERAAWRARARRQQIDRHTIGAMARHYEEFYHQRRADAWERRHAPESTAVAGLEERDAVPPQAVAVNVTVRKTAHP